MSKKRTTALSVQDLLKLKKGDFMVRHVKDEDIDCIDIPELTEEQMRNFKHLNAPVIKGGNRARSGQATKKRKP